MGICSAALWCGYWWPPPRGLMPQAVWIIKRITWTTTLSNSMKLWAMPCRATQDEQVVLESSDKMWSTGEGNGKPLQLSCLENPINCMKRHKYMILKDKLPRLVGAIQPKIWGWQKRLFWIAITSYENWSIQSMVSKCIQLTLSRRVDRRGWGKGWRGRQGCTQLRVVPGSI